MENVEGSRGVERYGWSIGMLAELCTEGRMCLQGLCTPPLYGTAEIDVGVNVDVEVEVDVDVGVDVGRGEGVLAVISRSVVDGRR